MLYRNMAALFVGLLFAFLSFTAIAQCPQVSFTLPDTVCINEPVTITNTSTGATRYEWDFCSGDLLQSPIINNIAELPMANIPTDITTVFDGTNWYSFINSRDNNKLFRLDYGNNLNNTPIITDLGNPGGLLSSPEQMKLLKVEDKWFGLIVNLNNHINNFKIVKLSFGTDLKNIPSAFHISSIDNYINQPRGIELINDAGNIIALIANAGNNEVTMVQFGNSLDNVPNILDIKTVALPSRTSGINLMGIAVVKHCNRWIGLAASFSNKLFKLDFGVQLFTQPESILEITTTQNLSLSPVKVTTIIDRGSYYALLMHINGKGIILNFGEDIVTNNTPSIASSFNIVGDFTGMEIVQDGTLNYFFTVDWAVKKVYRGAFIDNCSANNSYSFDSAPTNITYSQGGMQYITLKAFDANNNVSIVADSVFVRPPVPATFSVSRQCAGSATQFTAQNSLAGNTITSWAWDFGGGNLASGPDAQFTFPTSGSYPVKLTMQDACGATKTITETITIYQRSVADFITPALSCSGGEIHFTDASTAFDDEIIGWQWDFGDSGKSTDQNPVHIYQHDGNYTVQLVITGKSGCTETVTKSIEIKPGAKVNFSVENACLDRQTVFTDLTAIAEGANIISRQWDLGDGTISTEPNPVHTYAAGAYTVTLSVQTDQGCVIERKKDVVIRQLPRADYTFSLACANEPTAFQDESISVEGGVAAWFWSFDDPASGAENYSGERNPGHTFTVPGNYRVQLKIISVYGCADSLTKEITVYPAPQAAFTWQIDCQSRQVRFADQSVSSPDVPVTQWIWNFGDGTISYEPNPGHTYAAPGVYQVTLLSTASNRCASTHTQEITVFPTPVADFILPDQRCTNQLLTFTDQTRSPDDPVVNWHWDFGPAGQFDERHLQIRFTSAGDIPVSLTIQTASGCTASITKLITLWEVPAAQFTWKQSAQNPLQLAFTNVSSAEAVNFHWDFGDGRQSTQREPGHTYEQGGAYIVRLTATSASGCADSYTQEVLVSSIPAAYALKLEALNTSRTAGGIAIECRLLNGSPHPINELDLVLTWGNGQTYTHSWQGVWAPGTALNYSFSLPATTQAMQPEWICMYAFDAINQQSSNRQCSSVGNSFVLLEPYPNPASEAVTVAFVLPEPGNIRLNITDIVGKVVFADSVIRATGGYTEIPIQTHHLSAGVYYIRSEFKGKAHFKKIVVTR